MKTASNPSSKSRSTQQSRLRFGQTAQRHHVGPSQNFAAPPVLAAGPSRRLLVETSVAALLACAGAAPLLAQSVETSGLVSPVLAPNPSASWTIPETGQLSVGSGGAGRVEVTGGGTLVSGSAQNSTLIGRGATGDGTVVISGSGSSFTSRAGGLFVGYEGGAGSVLVGDGAELSVAGGYEITVIPGGGPMGEEIRRIEEIGGIVLGKDGGTGSLEVLGGSTVKVGLLVVGGYNSEASMEASSGTLVLDGVGSSVTVDEGLRMLVGGTVTVSGGAELKTFSNSIFAQDPNRSIIAPDVIGTLAEVPSLLRVTGAGSSYLAGNTVRLNEGGTLIVEDGALVRSADGFRIGFGLDVDGTGPSASLRVDNATLEAAFVLDIANGAAWAEASFVNAAQIKTRGTMIGSGGTRAFVDGVLTDFGARADVLVSGAGTIWTDQASAGFVGFSLGDSGETRLTVTDQALIETENAVEFGLESFNGARVDVEISGAARFTSISTTTLGVGEKAIGTLLVTDAGSSFNTDGRLTIGLEGQGEVTVQAEAKLTAGEIVIGSAGGTGTGILRLGSGSGAFGVEAVVEASSLLLNAGSLLLNGDVLLDLEGGAAEVGAAGLVSGSGVINAAVQLDGRLDVVGVIETRSLGGSGAVSIGTGSQLTTGDNNASTTLSGAVSGPGLLLKLGTGVLTLSGQNSFTGEIDLREGGLSLGNGGAGGLVGGDILNNGRPLTFNYSSTGSYGGVLSGSGETRFIGSGTTILTGDSGGYSGAAFVTAGQLQLAAGSVLGTDLLTVGANGMLSGAGRVAGDVALAGQLAAGSSVGTLTIDGDLALASGARLLVELDDGGAVAGVNNDLVLAETASLASGVTLHVSAANGTDSGSSYIPETVYKVLETAAPGGLSVAAAPTITDSFALLFFTGESDGQSYSLTSHLEDFCLPGSAPNQCATGRGVQSLGFGHAAYDAVLLLGSAEARAAFDAMSGEIHASGQQVIDQGVLDFSRRLSGQGLASVAASGRGAAAAVSRGAFAGLSGAHVWAGPIGGSGEVDSDGNAARLSWSSAGIAGGIEQEIGTAAGRAVVGLGFGYLQSSAKVPARGSSLEADGLYLGVYGAWSEGPWSLSGALSYGSADIASERRFTIGGVQHTARAKYSSQSFGVSAEAAYAFALSARTSLSPLLTLDANWSSRDGFTENGAPGFNLSAGSESWHRMDAGIGLAVAHEVETSQGRLRLDGRVVYEKALGDKLPQSEHRFDQGNPFTVNGASAASDRWRVGAGLSLDVSPTTSITARYSGLFAGDQAQHSGYLGLKVRF